VSFRASRRNGAFALPVPIVLTGLPFAAVASDLDLDGVPDLAAALYTPSAPSPWGVQVLLGHAGGRPGVEGKFAAADDLLAMAAGDVDGDGVIDVIARVLKGAAVFRGLGDGRLAAPVITIAGTGIESMAADDFDSDGHPDLVFHDRFDGIRFSANNGWGEFLPSRRAWPEEPRFSAANALVTGDFDQEGRVDLVTSSGSLLVATGVPLSRDCDGNGIPDECDALAAGRVGSADLPVPGECTDCDWNRIADAEEIAAVPGKDADGNGVLDACQRQRVAFEAAGPAAVLGDAGGKTEFHGAVRLHHLGFEAGEQGAAGWLFFLQAVGGKFTSWTHDGTVGAFAPDGLRNPDPGMSFASTGILSRSRGCEGAMASALVLGFTPPVTLDPSAGPAEVLRFTVETSIPSAGSGACGLRFVTCDTCTLKLEPAPDEGSGGCGGPDKNVVSNSAGQFSALDLERVVALGPARFLRGDANTDGTVDISDAVRILMFLFLGAAVPRCVDTADANDDGRADLSDAVTILGDFFIAGTAIAPPGPFECGADPSPDGLGCAGYEGCLR
jgi:hypothetical protein